MTELPLPLGDNEIVNSSTLGSQLMPGTLGLDGGGWITWWSDLQNDNQLRARVFDANGTPLGDDFRVSTTLAVANNHSGAIIQRDDGSLLAVWGDGARIWARAIQADGADLGPAFVVFQSVSINPPSQGLSLGPLSSSFAIATQDNGFALVLTALEFTTSRVETYVLNFDAEDTQIGIPVRLSDVGAENAQLQSEQIYALAQSGLQLDDGRQVVVWQTEMQTPTGIVTLGLQVAVSDQTGTHIAPAVDLSLPEGTWDPENASVTDLGSGRFLVAWDATDAFQGQRSAFAQIFDAEGGALDTAFRLNGVPGGYNSSPKVTRLPDGGFIATFLSDRVSGGAERNVVVQRYDADGAAIGEMFIIPAPPESRGPQTLLYDTPHITVQPTGHYIVTWEFNSFADATAGSDIYQRMFDHQIFGTDADEIFEAGPSGDWINGRGGADTITGAGANDTLHGGQGDDLVRGLAGNDVLRGGLGDDTLDGGLGRDHLDGGDGADLLSGGGSSDTLLGGDGNDTLRGDEGGDVLEGGAGDDHLLGGTGSDTLLGDDGNDSLEGQTGNDILVGGAGVDTILGGSGADMLDGGSGEDTLDGGSGRDVMQGGSGNDLLNGGSENDTLSGGSGNDTLIGASGNDLLDGGSGDDLLEGGSGSDTLIGGAGFDQLVGGSGADVFVFASAAHIGMGSGRDVIADFTSGVDRIDLSALATTFNGTAGFLAEGQASFFYLAESALLMGDQNGDGVSDWTLELSGTPTVTEGDFLL